jgi:hypothetical protein
VQDKVKGTHKDNDDGDNNKATNNRSQDSNSRRDGQTTWLHPRIGPRGDDHEKTTV